MDRIASGANYTVDVDGNLGICRVWSRPDLDVHEGARLAAEMTNSGKNLARTPAAGMLFDILAAPPVVGPKTQTAIGELLQSWHAMNKPIAMVVSSKSMQQLQMRRLLATYAPVKSGLFTSAEEAMTWLRANMREPSAAPASPTRSGPLKA